MNVIRKSYSLFLNAPLGLILVVLALVYYTKFPENTNKIKALIYCTPKEISCK
jgi:hypothetical protein